MAKNYHVTRRETGYAVVGAGNQRASSVHRTQGVFFGWQAIIN